MTIEDKNDNTQDTHGTTLISDEVMDKIAEKAARKALQIVYAEVGQSVLKKLAWLIGAVIVGLALYLAGKNSLPLEPGH